MRLGPLCAVEGCGNLQHGHRNLKRGTVNLHRLCKEHHYAEKKRERLEKYGPPRKGGKPRQQSGVCSVEGCGNPCTVMPPDQRRGGAVYERHVCREHWNEGRRTYNKRSGRTRKQALKRHQRFLAGKRHPYETIYFKRARRVRERLAAWCTQEYLKKARIDAERYEKAIRMWVLKCKWESLRNDVEYQARKLEQRRAKNREHSRISSKIRYWKDPERHRLKTKIYKALHPEKKLAWNLRRAIKELANSDGSITKEGIGALFVNSHRCPYCGDPYKRSRKSLDHIVSVERDGTHGMSNFLICCLTCNIAKGKKSLNDFLLYLQQKRKIKRLSATATKALAPLLFS